MKRSKILTLIPVIIAVLLMFAGAAGTLAVTASGLPFQSDDYEATFYMNHLQIHLLENSRDVCGGQNTLNGETKVTGGLLTDLGYQDEVLGTADPGRYYSEVIAARNGQDVPVYLRMTVRKYWVDVNEDGTAGDKSPVLSPKLIRLAFGSEAYNSEYWFLNEEESTSETAVYYYRTELAASSDTEPLFNSLVIDSKIMDKYTDTVTTEPDPENPNLTVTIHTYTYKYDGCAFVIKCDVQAIQTHNAEDAIHSQWGVYNITAADGKLAPAAAR